MDILFGKLPLFGALSHPSTLLMLQNRWSSLIWTRRVPRKQRERESGLDDYVGRRRRDRMKEAARQPNQIIMETRKYWGRAWRRRGGRRTLPNKCERQTRKNLNIYRYWRNKVCAPRKERDETKRNGTTSEKTSLVVSIHSWIRGRGRARAVAPSSSLPMYLYARQFISFVSEFMVCKRRWKCAKQME